jgi:hypothetical protein
MADYEDDAARIEREYVDPDSATEQDIRDDLDEAGFDESAIDSFVDDVVDQMGTVEDVGLDRGNAHADGITTAQDVERAVEEMSSDKISSDRNGAIADEVSSEIAAPSESELQNDEVQTLTQETVTPEGGSTPVSVVRNQSGDAVATIGGGSNQREQVADQVGAERSYSSPQEAVDDLGGVPAPDGSSLGLTLGDDVIGEVNT